MITIESTPQSVFFCGNPSQWKISTDNFLSQTGRKCSFQLIVTTADTATGHLLTFTFVDKAVTFTTVTTPDDSGLQVQKAASSGAWSTWCATLYLCLQSNYDISSRFKITLAAAGSSSRTIYFEAFDPGSDNSVVISTNMVTVSIGSYLAGLDALLRDNFCVIGGLWDTDFKVLARDIKPVDESGEVLFDFSEYLTVLSECLAGQKFTYPFDTDIVHTFSNYVLQLYAGFAERYSGTVRRIHYDDLRNAITGGLNRETLMYYNLNALHFFSVTGNQKSFMTWSPVDKPTGMTVPERLYFYVGPAPSYDGFGIYLKVYFTDGTYAEQVITGNPVSANQVIELSVGYADLNISSMITGSQVVARWEVNLFASGIDNLSETRIFRLDPQYYENERVFMFQNSFGRAYDVIRFTGKGSTDIKLEASTCISQSDSDVTSFNAPTRRFDASEGQMLKTNSGWVSREMKDYFRDFLLSKEVYEYKDNLLFPVIITNDAIKEHLVDDQYLYSLDLEYERAYRDFFFSKIPVIILPLGRNYCDAYSAAYS